MSFGDIWDETMGRYCATLASRRHCVCRSPLEHGNIRPLRWLLGTHAFSILSNPDYPRPTQFDHILKRTSEHEPQHDANHPRRQRFPGQGQAQEHRRTTTRRILGRQGYRGWLPRRARPPTERGLVLQRWSWGARRLLDGSVPAIMGRRYGYTCGAARQGAR